MSETYMRWRSTLLRIRTCSKLFGHKSYSTTVYPPINHRLGFHYMANTCVNIANGNCHIDFVSHFWFDGNVYFSLYSAQSPSLFSVLSIYIIIFVASCTTTQIKYQSWPLSSCKPPFFWCDLNHPIWPTKSLQCLCVADGIRNRFQWRNICFEKKTW